MRPLKLTVSAFGPYAGRVEMDLERLGRHGPKGRPLHLPGILGETILRQPPHGLPLQLFHAMPAAPAAFVRRAAAQAA